MNAWNELVERCARRRNEKIGPLSDEAYAELVLAVRQNPADFADETSEQALLVLARALDAWRASRERDDLLTDKDYEAEHARRLAALRAECERAVSIDPGCLDAHVTALLASELDPDPLLSELLALERAHAKDEPPVGDAWDDVFYRPHLRLRAAVARTCLDGARYRMAAAAAESVTSVAPADPLGARHTHMLACARLEDEDGLGVLEARWAGRESAWSHLARVLLLYKLNRLTAAQRALRGFDRLCAGGAYALLRPVYVEPCLPDRPEAAPCSFEEVVMAEREVEPLITDVPELIPWCQGHDWLVASARAFAERNDLDW